MRIVVRTFVAMTAAALLSAAGCSDRGAQPSAQSAGDVNFQQIIANAKGRVFPALVFVKPICEVYHSGERQRAEVFGSGVIISPDGYLITNNHVAEKAVQVNCVLGDREQVPAVVVGLDPETDLALLKLDLPDGHPPLPTAEFGDSDEAVEGQFVMALGSPFGFTRSISLGIISNTSRYIGFNSEHQYNLWLQTDAAINPGNSGGPLVDTDGKIIGVNTLGLSADGIGFAIPSNVVGDIASRLRAKAETTDSSQWPVKVDRAYTGMHLQALKDFNTNTFTSGYAPVSASSSASDDTPLTERGILIRNVERPSPAADAGVLPGDLLLAVDGRRVDGRYVEQLPAVRRLLAALPLDRPSTLTVARGEATLDLTVTPVLAGRVEGDDLELRRWNLTVKEITKYANPTLYFQHGRGVCIQGVRYPGCAADADLAVDDIIVKIGARPIRTLDDVKAAYHECLENETNCDPKVLVMVKRGGFHVPRVLDWTRDYLQEN